MAVLTKLEAKLGEVIGLAMAAQAATKKVTTLAKKDKATVLVKDLNRMHADARETEKRCTALASTFTGKKTAILDEARTVKAKGAEMMATYLDDDSDALDGFEFLTMAEAGEVGHWSVLRTLNETAGRSDIAALVAWALPIQEGHLKGAMAASVMLAGNEDPDAPA
jgi:hypothetical protein